MYSFKKQKKQNEVHGFLRRLIDTSSPNLNRLDGDDRWQGRCNRTFPVLLVPFEDKVPVVADAVFALTKNLSSQGAALVLHHPFRSNEKILIVFSVESSLTYIAAELRQMTPVGGGYWQVGVELREILSPDTIKHVDQLESLTDNLVPRDDYKSLPTAETLL